MFFFLLQVFLKMTSRGSSSYSTTSFQTYSSCLVENWVMMNKIKTKVNRYLTNIRLEIVSLLIVQKLFSYSHMLKQLFQILKNNFTRIDILFFQIWMQKKVRKLRKITVEAILYLLPQVTLAVITTMLIKSLKKRKNVQKCQQKSHYWMVMLVKPIQMLKM